MGRHFVLVTDTARLKAAGLFLFLLLLFLSLAISLLADDTLPEAGEFCFPRQWACQECSPSFSLL